MKIIRLTPEAEGLTTTEAAELLGISRQYLVELLDSGEIEIPFRKVGRYRRLKAEDVLNYKRKLKKDRLVTLEELQEQAQRSDLGY